MRIEDSDSSQARPEHMASYDHISYKEKQKILIEVLDWFVRAESAEEGPPLLGTIPRYKWKYACIFQVIHRDEAHEPTSKNYQESNE